MLTKRYKHSSFPLSESIPCQTRNGNSKIANVNSTLAQAAYSAAKVRLRPILMTVLSMVFGLIPLMLAHGVGANGSRSLATGVIGGMIVGTLALLFLVPSLFIVFQYIQERIKHN